MMGWLYFEAKNHALFIAVSPEPSMVPDTSQEFSDCQMEEVKGNNISGDTSVPVGTLGGK